MRNSSCLLIFFLLVLASCQTNKYMQDDMYFSNADAKREIRENANFQNANKTNNEGENKSNTITYNNSINSHNINAANTNFANDNYYNYSYSARLKRFQKLNNTWCYYDPYYTNYYWYNNSCPTYFGNSVYNTYSWWGLNFEENYKETDYTTNNWCNPWKNNMTGSNWCNPFSPSLNNGLCNLPNNNIDWSKNICNKNRYYNSYDNNCYWGWWENANPNNTSANTHFIALMQHNGISKDVIMRPSINYSAIRESSQSLTNNIVVENTNNNIIDTIKPTITNNNIVVVNNYNTSTTIKPTINNSNKNTNTNTYRRWDNYNADVNISPNNNNSSNWSRNGIFSEGSRNSNYEYKGPTMPNNNKSTQVKKVETQPKNQK